MLSFTTEPIKTIFLLDAMQACISTPKNDLLLAAKMNNTEPIEKEANLRTLNAVLQTELSVTQYHLATCQRKAEENERAFEKAKQAHEENINALQSDIVCLKEEVIELQAIIAAKDAISAGTAKTPTTQASRPCRIFFKLLMALY